jgi:hypothetical protein
MNTITTANFTIEALGDSVYFEHHTLGDECAASLRFDLRRLVDFSGVAVIPREVSQALSAAGYQL